MSFISYTEDLSLIDTVILIKDKDLRQPSLEASYILPLEALGVDRKRICVMGLFYNDNNKISAKEAREFLNTRLRGFARKSIKFIIFADSNYFKYYLGVQKLVGLKGIITEKDFVHEEELHTFHSTVIPNYRAIEFNSTIQKDLDLGLTTVAHALTGSGEVFTKNPIHSSAYLHKPADIKKALEHLFHKKELAIDIETKGLRYNTCGIYTIGFAWSIHEGIVIEVDSNEYAKETKKLLGAFFRSFSNKGIFYNKSFDVKVLIYELFMDNINDLTGMRTGIDLFAKYDDAMAIAFLAQNTVEDIKLKLKEQAYTYLGHYAEDVEDVTLVPIADLMVYNLKDCLATMFVYERDYPIMIQDEQLDYYTNMVLPSQCVTMEMEFVGLPIDPVRVLALEKAINITDKKLKKKLNKNAYVKKARWELAKETAKADNEKLKKKLRLPSEVMTKFNPGSPKQLIMLLYKILKLPVLDVTPTKAPSTSTKVINRLMNIAEVKLKPTLEMVVEISSISTLVSTFIPAFKNKTMEHRGLGEIPHMTTLNGSLNITKVQSGRMSGSDPNLTNLPSGSMFGKAVKHCFVAPEGWLFAAIDFNALEDKATALLTSDPARVEVFTKGYDSHSLKTYTYWKEKFPGYEKPLSGKCYDDHGNEISIDAWHVAKINSIKKTHDDDRTLSKPVTFALSYLGTEYTLINKSGFSPEEAKSIVERYTELHKVSFAWTKAKLQEAANKGYAQLAFGLRIRVGHLKNMLITDDLPFNMQSICRSINNAISQSYGLLLNRAFIEFRKRVVVSEYKDNVIFCNAIHDALYLLIKAEPETIEWVNNNVVECFQWQELPELQTEDIPLTANLDIGLAWDEPHELSNNASIEEITETLQEIYK